MEKKLGHPQPTHRPRPISRRTFLSSVVTCSIGLLASSCDSVRFPQIRAFVPGGAGGQQPWQGAANLTKFLHMVVDNVQPSGNVEVSVSVSRHRSWDGTSDFRVFMVPRSSLLPGETPDTTTRRYTFRPPHLEDYKDTQRVFFQWFVHALQPNGDRLLLAQSPQESFRIGVFIPAQTNQTLRAVQTSIVERFDRPLAPEQHGVPTHLHRCLRGMGIAFTRSVSLTGPINLFEPQLLLYIKREDDTWRLMGWAYGIEHTGLASHPIVSPIPWEAWFVHEAGWHPLDGGFIPTPPPSDLPLGSQAAPAPFLLVGLEGVWHPRIWDLHVFRRDNGVPIFDNIEDPEVARNCDDWEPDWFFQAPDVDVQPRA